MRTSSCRAIIVMAALLPWAGAGPLAAQGAASSPAPEVSGPIPGEAPGSPGHNYTLLATDIDLASKGWVEQEFFLSGAGNVYDAKVPPGVGSANEIAPRAKILSANHRYTTNIVVRRPADNAKFNGTVILEWTNVTPRYMNHAGWYTLHEALIRQGYAYAAVSNQQIAVTDPALGLKAWSPARYGKLDVTENGSLPKDALSFDIFSQAAQAIRANTGGLLGPLKVKRVIALGVSQSAGWLSVYLNAVYPGGRLLDGAQIEIGGEKIRGDLDIPVIKVLSESEFINDSTDNEIPVLQPDADGDRKNGAGGLRIWPVAGTTHSDTTTNNGRRAVLARDLNILTDRKCAAPTGTTVTIAPVAAAALDALTRWAIAGKAPPHAPGFQIIDSRPKPGKDVFGGHNVARDANNNALGAIRLPGQDAPVAVNTGSNLNPPDAPPGSLCFLNGSHADFTDSQLRALYPSRAAYLAKVTQSANAAYKRGFILKPDRDAYIATAKSAKLSWLAR